MINHSIPIYVFVDLFYPEDVQRLDGEDQYVIRFCKHVSEAKESYVEPTIQMIISTFQWRKNFGTRGQT
uniref:Uncharacterized protein n=1 Tax=Lepeophtheirus salmonis TaxID=72036 RepID=A0A0K2UDL0_LEPSM